MRRAPRGGYDFSRKRDYRRKVWATFRDNIKRAHIPIADAQALLMPSLEGDEIEVALNAGFRERNLHVVDMEPAIVATLKRRYPNINTYGVSVGRAVDRIARNGIRLDCANLDFCGNISASFAEELMRVACRGAFMGEINSVDGGIQFIPINKPGAFSDQAFIAVSTLRGREVAPVLASDSLSDESMDDTAEDIAGRNGVDTDWLKTQLGRHVGWDILRTFSNRDRQRLYFINRLLALEFGVTRIDINYAPSVSLLRTEFYLSTSKQTMLWSVWRVTSYWLSEKLREKADTQRIALGMPPLGRSPSLIQVLQAQKLRQAWTRQHTNAM